MKIKALIFFLLLSFNAVFSQEIGTEIRNGKPFKIHVVEAGNTLYGLHQKYGVTIEEIVENNPHIKEGMRIGQRVYIPINEKEEEQTEKINENPPAYQTHVVQKKETLFGISKKYNVTIDDLIRLNPGVEAGLKIGQELKISSIEENEYSENYREQSTDVLPNNEDFHDFIDDTPDTKEIKSDTSLQIGDTIVRTSLNVEFVDSIIHYKVQKGETLYSIANRFMLPVKQIVEDNDLKNHSIKPNQIIKIKLKQERITEVEVKEIYTEELDSMLYVRPVLVEEKEAYKVLVALPMKLKENPPIISGIFDESTKLNGLTEISVSFLMGVEMALDSLQKLGLNAKVEFFDTEGDIELFKSFLSGKNKNDIDVMFGPFYENLLEYAALWGKQNNVPVIAVTQMSSKILENNPFVISVIPSELTLIGGMAQYLAKRHSEDNIVIIQQKNEEEKSKIDFFVSTFNKYSNSKFINPIKIIPIGESNGKNLADNVQVGKENLYICLSDKEPTVMQFVNALNAAKNTYSDARKEKITIVGLYNWRKFSALNNYYKNRFEFHFPATNFLDYNRPEVERFTNNFRQKYGSDPSKYAVHGFDVTLSQLSRLLLNNPHNVGLMDVFSIQPVGHRHGSENSAVFISKQQDFEIKLLEIVTK